MSLKDELITTRNLVDVALLLDEQGYKVEKESHLATILETIFCQVQSINDETCVVRDE